MGRSARGGWGWRSRWRDGGRRTEGEGRLGCGLGLGLVFGILSEILRMSKYVIYIGIVF